MRALIVEGNNFAAGVGLSAGTLHETDQYVEGAFKVAANSLMGNPYASEDDITNMSWWTTTPPTRTPTTAGSPPSRRGTT
ncbi:hypothetical protein ABZV31_26950 [Streptomyces sp. NPDC005202]|uniref:hypothetical protein n=1 Tax=Streptomyces sp. NPDC005202 TaxID=3157021 RepID=UPI0033A9B8AB